ncbi:MAG: hypothetical protein NVV59_12575 [Chitinophagaceae bacterium]|nr:hypothetical protein [Chitinophagaceae bacterium]
MRAIGNILKWLVFTNVFIALCAVIMSWQAAFLFQLELPPALLPFIFFASLSSYSFHWYLSFDDISESPRIQWLRRNRNVHISLFIAGMAGAIYFGLPLLPWWPWLALSVVITFLYSAPKIPWQVFRTLRRIAYGKTIFLAMVWTYVTTVLPLVMSNATWTNGFTLLVISRFFLIYAICILFDYRDRDYDRRIGIRSLITWFNERQIALLFAFSIAVFFISTLALYFHALSVISIFLLIVPGILTAVSYPLATRNFSDYLYYAWLDGLMAVSSLLMWLLHLIKS